MPNDLGDRARRPWMLVLCGVLTACAVRERQIMAHYESPPDDVATVPPCDLSHWTPGKGACRGTGRSVMSTTITGDWEGKTEYQYGWLTVPSGVTYGAVIETFTGTVKGCGTGSISYYLFSIEDAGGNTRVTWTVIEGAGTGELARLSGHGTQTGVFRSDYSSSGDFRGSVECRDDERSLSRRSAHPPIQQNSAYVR